MTVYATMLPLVTALFGLACGLFIWMSKKVAIRKHLLLWLSIILISLYAFGVFMGMAVGNITLWQASIAFLSTALLTGMFFTIQITRDIREADSVFLFLFLISTTGGTLSIESAIEIYGVYLPVVSPILFGIFLVYVIIAWSEVLYNLIIVRIASRKMELKKYRLKLNYLFVGLNLNFVLLSIDAVFVYADVLIVPVMAVLGTLPILFLSFFVFER
ncbi:MAG: hypothetical protein QXO11_05990 [Thermoplasmata archaeon]